MNTAEMEAKFRVYFRSKGLKFTPERQVIINEALSIHHHFDVEELFARLRNKGQQVSRATIYRTIPLLIETKILKEAVRRPDDIVRYEHILGHEHHDHLVCLKCGRIYEFKDEQIEKLQERLCRKHKFKAVEHHMGILGYCRRCR